MATLERLTWGGIDVASWAIRVRDLSGLLAIPGRRGENLVVAGRDGAIRQSRKLYNGREFVLEFLVRGATADGRVPADRRAASVFYDNIDTLAALCVQDVAPMVHTLPDGIVQRRLEVEVLNTVEPERYKAGALATVKVALSSASPWWRALAPTVATFTLAAGAERDLVEFAGMSGRIDDALVTFAGGSTTGNNPRLVDVATGIATGYNRSFTAAESLTVGDYTWAPTGFTFDRTALVKDPRIGSWWVLDPVPGGAPRVRLDLSGGGPMEVSVSARQSWAVG